MAPLPSVAAPAADPAADGSQPEAEPGAGDPASGAEPGAEGDTPGDLQPTVTELEPSGVPTGGGVAGAVVDPDDPNAARAQSDLEGESLDSDLAGVPERVPKLQAAGWWTTFSAVALATTGGILAGIAETRQDEAERMAYSFDLDTGRTTLYGPVAADYEGLLSQGQTYQWIARGFIIAGGATLIAGIALFSVDGVRRRRAARSESARVRLDPGLGGLGLRF
ncbi:hypothetical protein ENSA5_31250 [Enhygromyxa salina]|uniref:Uncharacterized protein n=1 Tax=Enhygromyxa salina TaxID=215803 RepID=A0A2S9XYF8_9BACT|nr:hypothetical protein [Enhygromyxa salina]PRP97892.1 hypothetical protein ENSA5_31250 [Enhygromyxa salina]